MRAFLKKLVLPLLALTIVTGVLGLTARFKEESMKKDVTLLVEYADVEAMARQSGVDFEEMLSRLFNGGITAVSFKDLTGADLRDGDSPVLWGTLRSLLPERSSDSLSDNAALFIPKEYDDWFFEKYLKARFPGCATYAVSGGSIYVLPREPKELLEVGVIPDLVACRRLSHLNVPLVYRPSPTFGISSEDAAKSLDLLFASLWRLRGILPQGSVVFGYPDFSPIMEVMNKYGAVLLQPEFARLIGENEISWKSFPNILPLHSVTTVEIVSRNLSRPTLVERFARAARERSVRVLLLRPYEVASGPWIESFEQDLAYLRSLLERDGFVFKFGEPYPEWVRNSWAVVSFLTASLYLLIFLASMEEEKVFVSTKWLLGIALVVAALALGSNYLGIAAKIMGAFLASFGAFAATLAVLEAKKPLYGLLKGVCTVLAVGFALSSFFGTPLYMMRLLTFSGVKATLALPPLLVLLHDMTRRRYPEKVGEVLKRPPIWGELLILFVLVLAAAVVLLRSGNVPFVPKWEVALRDAFERYLVARPRNKEIFIGYPALWLALAMGMTKSKAPFTRFGSQLCLLARMASSLAFASAVNSFCHFHTRIYFICWRVFNGLWVGSFFGLVLVVAFFLALKVKAFRRLLFCGEEI